MWLNTVPNDAGTLATEMTIHMPEFGKAGSVNDFTLPEDPSSLCGEPALQITNYEVANLYPSSSAGNLVRPFGFLKSFVALLGTMTAYSSSQPVPVVSSLPNFEGRIVASHHSEHNATKLCASPSSLGPDFVSFHEGIYCDMLHRTTWPLCRSGVDKGCFDWDSRSVIDGTAKKRALHYVSVTEWK
jgi:hypothetical protein